MVEITESKINKINVEVLKPKEEFNERSVLGWNYLPNPYSNVFLCAKKASGKTNVIYNLIKNVIDKRTKVIIFSGSVDKDNTYKEIIKYCNKKNIDCTTYHSFLENRVNLVDELIRSLRLEEKQEKDKAKKVQEVEHKLLTEENDPRPPRKKKKKIVPQILLIFDDLGNVLRDQSIATLSKLNRHYKIMNLMSFHANTDILPSTSKQADFIMLFQGYTVEKLEKLHADLLLSVNFDTLLELYRYATREKYHFLYIDVRNNKYRKNFDIELNF